MSKKDYDLKYQKENIKRIYFVLNKKTDADIIELLEDRNVNAYLKSIIRWYIKYRDRNGEELLFGIEEKK